MSLSPFSSFGLDYGRWNNPRPAAPWPNAYGPHWTSTFSYPDWAAKPPPGFRPRGPSRPINAPPGLEDLFAVDPDLAGRIYGGTADANDFRRATLISKQAAEDQFAAQREQGIGSLQTALGRYQTQRAEDAADPFRMRLREEIARRSDPNYRAITEQEEQAGRNTLAQQIARATSGQAASAAGRGTFGSGFEESLQATTRAVGEGQSAQLSAEIAGQNRSAQDRALGLLQQLDESDRAYETQITNAMASIDALIARIRTGYEPQPTDFLIFEALDAVKLDYENQQQFAQDALAAAEREAEFDFGDFFARQAQAIGGGPTAHALAFGSSLWDLFA